MSKITVQENVKQVNLSELVEGGEIEHVQDEDTGAGEVVKDLE